MQQDVWELRLSLGNVSWKVQTSWCNLKQTGQCFFKYHLYSLTVTQSSRKWLWFSLKLLCRSSVLWLTLLSTSHHGKKNWSDQQHGSWNQRDSEPAEESKSLSALQDNNCLWWMPCPISNSNPPEMRWLLYKSANLWKGAVESTN